VVKGIFKGVVAVMYEGLKNSIKELVSSLLDGVEVLGRVDNYPEFLAKFSDRIIDGTFVTIEQSLLAIAVAVTLAMTFGIGRNSNSFLIRALSTSYIEFFRGTSLMVQLFWIFYVLPFFGLTLEPYTAGFVAVGLNLGAYGAEVVRGAIQSVPRGQYEAALALNMSPRSQMRRIIFPQALVIMLPAWGNLLIELVKGTALVGLISVTDLMFQSRQLYSLSYAAIETFGTVLLVYYILARLVITPLMRLLEVRLSRNLKRS
jgi:polar amino acid transport system permease protein